MALISVYAHICVYAPALQFSEHYMHGCVYDAWNCSAIHIVLVCPLQNPSTQSHAVMHDVV